MPHLLLLMLQVPAAPTSSLKSATKRSSARSTPLASPSLPGTRAGLVTMVLPPPSLRSARPPRGRPPKTDGRRRRGLKSPFVQMNKGGRRVRLDDIGISRIRHRVQVAWQFAAGHLRTQFPISQGWNMQGLGLVAAVRVISDRTACRTATDRWRVETADCGENID